MPVQKSSHRKRFFGRLILLVIAIAAAGGAGFGWVRYQHRKPPIERYETTGVRRANLFPTLMASGRVRAPSGRSSSASSRTWRSAYVGSGSTLVARRR